MDTKLPQVIVDTMPPGITNTGQANRGAGANSNANKFLASRVLSNRNNCLISASDYLPLASQDTDKPAPKPQHEKARGITSKQNKKQALNKVKELDPVLCSKLLEMWRQYFSSLVTLRQLNSEERTPAHDELVRMDLIGCPLHVIRSKALSQTGLEGIVVMETKGTFRLAHPKTGKIRTVPKAGSDFKVDLEEGFSFVLFGSQLAFRPAERATRRWKNPDTADVNFETVFEIWKGQH